MKRLRLPAAPYIVLCALVANVGSLLIPVSNLTNLLFADAFHLTFAAFTARMFVPQLVALATAYALLLRQFRRELPERFEVGALAEPSSVVESLPYFALCVAALAVALVGYFVAPLAGIQPYVVAFACGGRVAPGIARRGSHGSGRAEFPHPALRDTASLRVGREGRRQQRVTLQQSMHRVPGEAAL